MSYKYSTLQTTVLTILRLVIGYHFLYEGVDKLLDPTWTAGSFLFQANWLFQDIFHFIAETPAVLKIIDVMNIYGLILIGIGLILGLWSKTAAYFGALLLLFYYIAIPPFMNYQLFIDKNIVELLALLIIALFNTSEIIGIDRIVKMKRNKNG